MKKLLGLIVVCFSLSAVVFAEDTQKAQNAQTGTQITADTNQACDLNALNAQKQELITQKKEILAKIKAVKKQIRHCKGPGKITKKLMEQSERHEKTPM
jgi:hypothetical protein